MLLAQAGFKKINESGARIKHDNTALTFDLLCSSQEIRMVAVYGMSAYAGSVPVYRLDDESISFAGLLLAAIPPTCMAIFAFQAL